MQHVRSTLQKLFAATLKESGADGVLLAWPAVCGAAVAKNSRAVCYADGVLTIEVPDPAWRRQLREMQPQYIAAINPMSPQPVKEIKFLAAAYDRVGREKD